MSDTPRTDAQMESPGERTVPIEFARQLERELAKAEEECGELAATVEVTERAFNVLGERCWQACCMHIEPAVAETYPFAIWDRTRLLELELAKLKADAALRGKL